ncbi:MAG: hypothetical protein LBM74_06940 [Oscillospiraceae bacterium]|jgi:hypothetical protein|nr:hypothetical protein [Oscillospiraceae bacterium]
MSKPNLFWPVYNNLEKEVLSLAHDIHFCDDQLAVYSVKIAELLLRCAIEIESIAKSLYEQEGGNMQPKDANGNDRYLHFDFDCLKWLDQNWCLGKKVVLLSSSNMFFSKDENRILHPLKNAHKGEAYWQKAYQAVKHNRADDIRRATVRNLIGAMAALYLLNVYYRNETFDMDSKTALSEKGENMTLDSSLFSVKRLWNPHTKQFNLVESSGNDERMNDAAYLVCHKDETVLKIREEKMARDERVRQMLLNSTEFQEFSLEDDNSQRSKSLEDMISHFGIWIIRKKLSSYSTKEEKLKAIASFPEYKAFIQFNPKSINDGSDDEILGKGVVSIGIWYYMRMYFDSNSSVLDRLYNDSRVQIVLNKGQEFSTGKTL